MTMKQGINEKPSKENNNHIRILFLADTHLGLDLPQRPRVERRRRGVDFFESFERALEPAFNGKVDLVVHGGDILFRSRVQAWLVSQAFEPLKRLADQNIPVYVIPGNHERSKIPFPLLAFHPHIHIFDLPRTFVFEKNGMVCTLSGFPYERHSVRQNFEKLIEQTGWMQYKADIRILCMHHIVEGAQVGPHNFTFRSGRDVIPCRNIPLDFAAILSGHIHRYQILTTDLHGSKLPRPVIYPGSTDRTSFQERLEPKGYFLLEFVPSSDSSGSLTRAQFCHIPTRPMFLKDMDTNGLDVESITLKLERLLAESDKDSILRIRVRGSSSAAREVFTAQNLRRLAPPTMNVSLSFTDDIQKNLRIRK